MVDAVAKLVDSSLSGAINIATGVGTNPNRIFEMIAELCDHDAPPVHVAPRAGDIEKIYLDVAKAKSDLGWEPTVSFEDGLRQTVEWFKQQAD